MRWRLGAVGQRWVKDQRGIAIDETLKFASEATYRLASVIVHSGGATRGHYVAYAKHYGQWFKCDDASVSQVDWELVRVQQAYVLFYEADSSSA